MRSRYTAFSQSNLDYLSATHHPDHQSATDPKTLAKSIRSTQWLNLIVLSTRKGQRRDKTGIVEFVAAYRNVAILDLSPGFSGNRDDIKQMHERSQFVKENGTWLYTTGEMLPYFIPKRDQRCWCGSPQKFKQCHGSR